MIQTHHKHLQRWQMALLVAVKSLKLASTAKNKVNPNLSSVNQFFEDDHGMLSGTWPQVQCIDLLQH
jgi:hypothetical protein